jgi:hypothetical protein
MVSNQVVAPLLTESFPKIPRARHEAPWFQKSQHDKTKQKKQPNLDIEDYLLLFLKNWQPETLIFHKSEIIFGELAKRPLHGTLANMSPLD